MSFSTHSSNFFCPSILSFNIFTSVVWFLVFLPTSCEDLFTFVGAEVGLFHPTQKSVQLPNLHLVHNPPNSEDVANVKWEMPEKNMIPIAWVGGFAKVKGFK
ncbi:hypothetical protein J6590_037380 [Homalodisca vitripennis]|nr:hypothetical protein J6590_037380 [Homalodisca vitripennis]